MAALLAVAMMLQMLPMLAFAEDATGTGKPVAWIGNQGYTSLQAAVDAASSNATTTIKLGEGVYSLGGTQKVTDKSLTFVLVPIEQRGKFRLRRRPMGLMATAITVLTAAIASLSRI